MSFTFGFNDDDLEDENGGITNSPAGSQTPIRPLQASHQPLQNDLAPPQKHSFAEFLDSLPSQISYNKLEIPSSHGQGDPIQIPRRSLFDIRQQLMWEADPSADSSSLLEGLATGDLQQGTYEGGFKTWECSIDLAQLLMHHDLPAPLHVIELGAGSAVPSLLLLQRILQRPQSSQKVKFTLCDYNVDVLRLCTAVNVYLALVPTDEAEGELEVGDEHKAGVLKLLQDANVEVEFVSGAWGREFCGLLGREPDVACLVLASETVYSPASMDAFAATLVQNLEMGSKCTALVAAKKVYFGVGGGIAEFHTSLERYNGIARTVLDVPGSGVGRVILDVGLRS